MRRNSVQKNKIGWHLVALFTIVVWGTTFIASKYLLDFGFTPVQIIIVRFILAYVSLWIIRPQWSKPVLKDELGYLVLGLFGCTVYFWAENNAILHTIPSNVSILVSLAPIMTAILAHFFTRDEKLSKNVIIGAAFAIVGVVLVVFNGTMVLKLSPVGDLLSLAAALCWAIYSLFLKRFVQNTDPVVLSRKTMFYGLITAIPLLLIGNKPIPAIPVGDWLFWLCLVFLGILASAVCYVTWNVAAKELGIIATNNYIYVLPFVTLILDAVLLGHSITLMGAAGSVLLVLGVAIGGKIRKKTVPTDITKTETENSDNKND